MNRETEGQALYDMVRDRAYDSDLRSEITGMGLKRIGGNRWLSPVTGAKYEFVLTKDETEPHIARIDLLEKERRIHLTDAATATEGTQAKIGKGCLASDHGVHHRTVGAFRKKVANGEKILQKIDQWNNEMERGTELGLRLREQTNGQPISWEDFIFLPDPLGSGKYIFGVIRKGKVAAMRAWLNIPGGNFIMPPDDDEEGLIESLRCGLDFHTWEVEQFETPAQAVKYAVGVLNATDTVYAQTIKKVIGKEVAPLTRNDFHRNQKGVICRVEVQNLASGIVIDEVPIVPTLADALDSLLAPVITATVLSDKSK